VARARALRRRRTCRRQQPRHERPAAAASPSPIPARGATPASDICVHVRPQLAKGALAAIICPLVALFGGSSSGVSGQARACSLFAKSVLDTLSLGAHTFGGAQAQRGGWGERFLPSGRASRERLWAAERPPESARGSAVPAVSQSLRSSFRSKPQGKVVSETRERQAEANLVWGDCQGLPARGRRLRSAGRTKPAVKGRRAGAAPRSRQNSPPVRRSKNPRRTRTAARQSRVILVGLPPRTRRTQTLISP